MANHLNGFSTISINSFAVSEFSNPILRRIRLKFYPRVRYRATYPIYRKNQKFFTVKALAADEMRFRQLTDFSSKKFKFCQFNPLSTLKLFLRRFVDSGQESTSRRRHGLSKLSIFTNGSNFRHSDPLFVDETTFSSTQLIFVDEATLPSTTRSLTPKNNSPVDGTHSIDDTKFKSTENISVDDTSY